MISGIDGRIIKNAVKCNICGDVIESERRHDFKTCSCGNISVDGGHDYLRRLAKDFHKYTELSISLKPCPFCGGKAELSENLDAILGWVKVVCTNCHVSTETFTRGCIEEREKEVIDLWNRRCKYE